MPLPHIWIVDGTDHQPLIAAANAMCAREYSRLYGHDVTDDELHRDFCDSNPKSGQRTLIAMGYDEEYPCAQMLGTTSIRFGNATSEADDPLDFMRLLRPADGWSEYRSLGFNRLRAIEACRFAYAESCQGASDAAFNLRVEVFRRLHDAALLAGAQHDCNQLWAVLPLHVAMFIKHKCRIPAVRAEGLELNHQFEALFQRYPQYWLASQPALYRTSYATPRCESALHPEPIVFDTSVDDIPIDATVDKGHACA